MAVEPVEPVAPEASEVATTSGRWQPAIQEIETDHDALGRVYFERDDDMEIELCDAFGLFFLDVESGSVEGWTWDAPILPSPGNRFVHFPSDATPVVYDRASGRSYTWDAAEWSLVRAEVHSGRTYTDALLGWRTDSGEHLVFRTGSRYAVVDESMRAVAWFELDAGTGPPGWAHPDGTHVLMRSGYSGADTLYSIDLDAVRSATVQTRPLPPARYGSRVQVSSAGDGLAVISWNEDETCTISRFDWALTVLSEVTLPCDWSGIDLSPDGASAATVTLSVGEEVIAPSVFPRLTTVSIFDAATGEERLRVKGALPSEALFGVHDGRSRWLADGSGLVLDTRDDSRIVRIEDARVSVFPANADFRWWGLLIPGPDRLDRLDRPFELYLRYCAGTDETASQDRQCRDLGARVVDGVGRELASARVALRIPHDSAWNLRVHAVGYNSYNRTSWGLTSDELRMHLVGGGPPESTGLSPALAPLIDRPPFAALTSLEVAGSEACLPLREAPDQEAASLACLLAGTIVESVAPRDDTHYDRMRSTGHLVGSWAHVRTEDGVDGWLPVASLRWAE